VLLGSKRSRRLEVPGEELLDVALFVALGDGCEDAGQVGVGLDFVELADLDEGRAGGPVSSAFVVACEECVLSVEGNRADRALNSVAVHLDPAVFEEQLQTVPIAGDVFERLSSWRFGRDLATGTIKPIAEGRYFWC